MDIKLLLNNIAEIIYALCGLISISTAIRGLKNEKAKIGTFLFWLILGVIFIAGKFIPLDLSN